MTKQTPVQFIVLVPEGYAAGPFPTREAAQAYVATDWQATGLKIMELVPPASSDD